VRKRIQRTGRSSYRLRLPARERDVLRTLPEQLRELLGTDDPTLARLFPPAYPDDPKAAGEYDELMREELLAGHLEALRVMEETVDAERLDERELSAWLGALNDLRLVLGTRLGVTEETYGTPLSPGDPRAPELALYGYLSWLQEEAVDALATDLGS
jgi:Domain of unknown function (DUF2017)